MNPVSAFRNIQGELSKTHQLPLPVNLCVKSLSIMHWVWWLCRKRKLVTSENIIPATAGTALDVGLKFTPAVVDKTVRGIAKLILVATRIDESVQRMQSLTRAFIRLKQAFTKDFSPLFEPKWVKHSNSIILSVETLNRWKTIGKEIKGRIQRICHCLLKVFVKIFKLNMHIADIYHALVFSHDAVPELFVNGMYWYRKIRHNKDYIVTKLEEYRDVIQLIFNATQTSSSSDDLIDKAKNALDFTVKSAEFSERVKGPLSRTKKVLSFMKSNLLGKEFIQPIIHTPFMLNNRLVS